MATIKKVTTEVTPRGVLLVKVLFTPQTPEPAKESDVEAVFEVLKWDTSLLDNDRYVMVPLSCTRKDTREPYLMSKEQRNVCIDVAMEQMTENSWD